MDVEKNVLRVKADLHNHFRTSSRLYKEDFSQLVDLARLKLGAGGIVGYVNFDDRRYEHLVTSAGCYDRVHIGDKNCAVYVPCRNVLIIKGQEVPTQQGHILALGLGFQVHLKQHRTLEDTLKEAADNHAIIIADHPLGHRGLGDCIGEYLLKNLDLIQKFDALEVHNGESCFAFGSNKKAKRLYLQLRGKGYDIGALFCSDGHSSYELGSSWTEIERPDIDNPSNFVESLRKSVRGARLQNISQKRNSWIGSVDHFLDRIWILNLAPKLGLVDNFEIDRPRYEKD